ncbi:MULTISPECIES: GTP-binding protein [unclassified Halomonas]|uniref:CobW family GTP-binding protein n=1 Tax=unclassified Halomonas TaxID=2609666 RepID=UPI0007D9ACE4|nr:MULTISPECIES: GTP-binding protein [unclassified Halomonas]MBT2786366.1 GTP-binding protein [Halomonas sp. ISL-106]MBT2797388.1 GTP-binding protein [Halomonas sp. ISL-104]OAL58755.1 cobalamin biosynthesis protein P47K [Halomonas sp. ALS9]
MQEAPLIPVNLLTGFLGSGKTTLLNRWVHQTSMHNTLVVINEFGAIGLDHQLITHSDEQAVIEMSSGCLCCTLRGDLSRTLQQAMEDLEAQEKPLPARVVIETTGLAEPTSLLQLLMTDHWLAHRFKLDSVVCCVDAANGLATLDAHPESQQQIAVADKLLITKTDLASEESVSQLANRLAKLNPAAAQWQVINGELSADLLVGAGLHGGETKGFQVEQWLKAGSYAVHQADPHPGAFSAPLNRSPLNTHQPGDSPHSDGINAFCFSVNELIEPDALQGWLDVLMSLMGDKMLRIKAIVHLTDRETPLALHGVQHIFHPPAPLPANSVSDRVSRFVFITQNVAPDTVAELYNFFNSSQEVTQ